MIDADDLTGKTLGNYTILKKLGQGGMAVVYKGYQESLGRYVAIKVLRQELADNQEFILRFRREALSIAKLSHPNILHLYDAGTDQGHYYIAMDYAEGGSLKDLIQQGGPLSVERAASIASQVADALDLAHRQGLVHRDVKPANILLMADGRPVLSDFGIARALYDSTPLTRTGTSVGTPDYMAPEQIQGRSVDGRADIYALGIVLFEMLAGFAPFRTTTAVATLYKQVNDLPPLLRQVNPNLPAWLEAVVSKALAKAPDQRYQHASDFARDLSQRRMAGSTQAVTHAYPQITVPSPPPSHNVTRPQPAGPRSQQGLVSFLIGAIVVLLLLLAAGGAFVFLRGPGETSNTPTAEVVLVVASPQPSETLGLTAEMEASPTTEPETPTEMPVIPTATAQAVPTAEPTLPPTPEAPTAAPTAAPTKPPATQPPPPPSEPGVIADFENFGTWRRGDEPNGTFTQSNAQAHQGSYSGRLDYQFGTASNDYVVFQQAHPIGGQPSRITAWVLGDGSGHFLNVWIKDKAGQVWQVPLGTVAHTGWQQMAGALDVNQAWPWAHISGPENGIVDYPISFLALVLDDKPDPFTGSGTLYVDDLRADTGTATTANTGSPAAQPTSGQPAQPTAAPAPATNITGRIAFSAGGALRLVDAKTGEDTVSPVPNMRQPDFRSDGQLLIVNGEGGGQDSLWTARASGGLDREQSTHPDDYYPFFSPSNGSRFVYNSTMMGKGHHNLFIGNLNSRQEVRNPLSYGGGPIIGSHPVWLGNDTLVYTGCDYGFGNGTNCGLYIVPSWGGQPSLVVGGGLSEYATDAHGTQVLLTTQRDGNWELYLVNANGSGLRNLSNSAGSHDGLGTFSPDGKWIAFVSTRDGNWAVWAIRPDGSGLTKLFNLPARLTGTWTDERISWGP